MTDDDQRLEAYLNRLDAAALRKLVLDAARRDDAFRERLQMAAAAANASGLEPLRDLVAQTIRQIGFLDWYAAGEYASRLNDLAEVLTERITLGDPRLVLVIEEAIALAEKALQQVDDSNGEVMDAIFELRAVHLAACNALQPDPIALAERLADLQLHGEWETFAEVIPDYADALGDTGFAHYRAQIEEAWQALPPLTPSDAQSPWGMSRSAIEAAMQALARYADDVNLEASVLAKNLSSPSKFASLATLLRAHGRNEEALDWTERGIAAFPGNGIGNLLDLSVALNLALGNHAEVERRAWQRFEQLANCDAFFTLLATAEQIDRGAALRDKALAYLWARVAEDESPEGEAKRHRREPPRRGDVVSIFLREGQAEAMWAAFCGGSVDTRLWDAVATERGKTHPEDAIALYHRLLPHVVEQGTHASRYDEAFAVVKKISELRVAHGQRALFTGELAAIRQEWKRKRNFMKRLDAL